MSGNLCRCRFRMQVMYLADLSRTSSSVKNAHRSCSVTCPKRFMKRHKHVQPAHRGRNWEARMMGVKTEFGWFGEQCFMILILVLFCVGPSGW